MEHSGIAAGASSLPGSGLSRSGEKVSCRWNDAVGIDLVPATHSDDRQRVAVLLRSAVRTWR